MLCSGFVGVSESGGSVIRRGISVVAGRMCDQLDTTPYCRPDASFDAALFFDGFVGGGDAVEAFAG
jgi:hypothetical protein